MVFSSIPFIFFFFPIFLIIYYIVPFKLKNIILLIFSLIFYAWGEPVYILLMIFSSLLDYTCGILLGKYKKKKIRNLILIESIVINLLLLSFFKYSDFLIENINNIFNLNIPLLNLPLPIGISFFTFQTMSYTIDVYKHNVKEEKNFLNFMTYVSMFPQLIAGPIVRYETVHEELEKREINLNNFCNGFARFLTGLFKKVLIANTLGFLWVTILDNFYDFSSLTLFLGVISFSLQIYFDFSGYSDMAIGMGKMLGFNYLENFNYPYISKSITEFWRRWHISLSTFFKDYVYIPLGGNRCSKIKNIRNILIVWALTGFWHGASWNFLIWGVYFGIILILEKFILNKYLEKLPNFFKHIYAILLILIGWLIFSFEDMNMLISFSKRLIGINTAFIASDFFFFIKNYFIIILLGIIFSTPISKILKEKINSAKYKGIYCTMAFIGSIILFIVTISFLVSDTYNPFLYFRF